MKKIKLSCIYFFSIFFAIYVFDFYAIWIDSLCIGSKPEVLKDVREYAFFQEDVESMKYPVILSENWNESQFYPVSSLSNAKMVVCKEDNGFLVIETDQFGLRNQREDWREGIYDYVITGDSFAMGECVDDEETIKGHLSKIGKSVLNLGVSGNGPTVNLMALKTFTRKIKATKVAWLFFEGNDFSDLKAEMTSPIYSEILERSINIEPEENVKRVDDLYKSFYTRKLQSPLSCDDFMARVYRVGRAAFKLDQTFSALKSSLRSVLNAWKSKGSENSILEMRPSFATIDMLPAYLKVVKRAHEYAQQSLDSDFLFVYIPDPYRYKADQLQTELAIKNRILESVRDMNIEYVDFDEFIKKKGISPQTIFSMNGEGHLNERGYYLVANLLESVGAD